MKVVGYRTRFTYGKGARGDIAVLENGQVKVIEDKCLCSWCCKSCKLQGNLVAELVEKMPSQVGRGRDFSPYPRGTRGKWVVLPEMVEFSHLLENGGDNRCDYCRMPL